jgi:hypothetical protein
MMKECWPASTGPHDHVATRLFCAATEFECLAGEQLILAVEHRDRRQAAQVSVEEIHLRVGEVHTGSVEPAGPEEFQRSTR